MKSRKRIYILGVIFPDIISTIIRSRLAKSEANLFYKALKINEPSITADKKIFRIINGPGWKKNKYLTRKEKIYIKTEISKLIDNDKFILSKSDIRTPGYWASFKGLCLGANLNISDYIYGLCDKEKKIISYLNGAEVDDLYIENYISFLRDIFFIPESILEEFESNITLFRAYRHIHQFMHVVAMVEHELYSREGMGGSKKELFFNLLPRMENKNKHITSVKRFISMVREKSGCTTKKEFIEKLCRKDIEEYDRIKIKIRRWESGELCLNSEEFLSILYNSRNSLDINFYVPIEIPLSSVIIDRVVSDCIELGMTYGQVYEELSKYYKYQRIDFDGLGNNTVGAAVE